MARMSPADRREAIVAATLSVLERRGIAAVTVRDVAAELGVSSGLIHHYYASMDELVAVAFERVARADLAETVAAVAAGSSPLERLRLFFDTYARSDGDEGMQVWLDAWAEAARRPALQRSSRRLNEEWQALLASVIAEGSAAGTMTVADSPGAAAWRVLSLLDGLSLQVVAHGDVLTAEQADLWSRQAAERELGLTPGTLSR
ncbi:TetR/AcrR family transcriptional regulator [Nocardioides sp.]|uniref:TetR/AcrR family transcriptional regulator n=1 Tax=Nocardioides sp. TaxID=35761 RepID=UPI003527ACE7